MTVHERPPIVVPEGKSMAGWGGQGIPEPTKLYHKTISSNINNKITKIGTH